MNFIDIGFGNLVAAQRVLCVVSAESSPARRMIQDSKDRAMCIDCCAGKKCKAVMVTDSDHVVLSSLAVEEIKEKLCNG
ncbi:MAG: DUF370 domain-containing protein [Clostridiales bacterium]|nr:DUF370 domain-containing protein [Clostridiales bacterium]